MKKCTTCGESDQKAFSPSRKTICKPCKNAQNLAWHLANPGKGAASSKRFRDANPGKSAASTKKWRDENPEESKASTKKWRDENPEESKASNKKWRQNNPDKNAAKGARYRASQLQRTPPWCNQEELKPFYTDSAAQGMQVDHIVPMQGELVSGLNIPGNLQLLTPRDNQEKSNIFDIETYPNQGERYTTGEAA